MDVSKIFTEITETINCYDSEKNNVISTLDNIINICNGYKNKIRNSKLETRMKKKFIKLLDDNEEYFKEYFKEYNMTDFELIKNKCYQNIDELTIIDVENNQVDYIMENSITFNFENFKISRSYSGDNEGDGTTTIILRAQDKGIIFRGECGDLVIDIKKILKKYTFDTVTKFIMFMMTNIVNWIFEGKVLNINNIEWY